MAMPMPAPDGAAVGTGDPAMEGMGAMGAHMAFSPLRPERPGDRQRAEAIVARLRQVIAPYEDVHRAEADGFAPNLPGLERRHYHFSRRDNFMQALLGLDVDRPTSLLYDRTPDGSST